MPGLRRLPNNHVLSQHARARDHVATYYSLPQVESRPLLVLRAANTTAAGHVQWRGHRDRRGPDWLRSYRRAEHLKAALKLETPQANPSLRAQVLKSRYHALLPQPLRGVVLGPNDQRHAQRYGGDLWKRRRGEID